jgi:methionyl-tRNA synthetase
LALYKEQPDFVVPDFRLREIQQFVEQGLQDFSISRLKAKMPWGVPVPGDEAQVMYVWFDALVNYISTLGWPNDMANFSAFWPGTQFAGKDNLRQQSAMWQAMLMSANLPTSKQIVIHGFITSGGQKMSKSLGNVVDPLEIVKEYGTDALRYWLLRGITPFEDGDFTLEKFAEAYNANLANGLGNATARILKMVVANDVQFALPAAESIQAAQLFQNVSAALDGFHFEKAMNYIWQAIGVLDEKIQKTEPFKLIKTGPENAKKIIAELAIGLWEISLVLQPFLPETARKIMAAIQDRQLPPILFPRK